jgi:UDP-glucose 4-epimerase
MVVLLTGGLGYIGSHICVALLQQGHQVIIVDNLANASRSTLAGIKKIAAAPANLTFIHADLLHLEALTSLFISTPIDAVIHLAGYKAVAESILKPLDYYRNNLVTTINLLTAMEAGGCRKLLFSSSATVYGSHPSPLREDAPTGIALGSPYGRSKYFIEEMLKDYGAAHPDFSLVILRYFNPVGAHPSGLIGEDPQGIPNNLLPILSRVALAYNAKDLAKNSPADSPRYFSIFGNDYPTVDGTCVRDFIHICDLADAHVSSLQQEPGLEIYNVGTGSGTSVLSLVAAYQRYNSLDIPYRFAPRRPGDSAATYCATDKLFQTYGWKAQKTIEDIVVDSWRWTLTHATL